MSPQNRPLKQMAGMPFLGSSLGAVGEALHMMRIFIELMTSGRKIEAPKEGSK